MKSQTSSDFTAYRKCYMKALAQSYHYREVPPGVFHGSVQSPAKGALEFPPFYDCID